MQDDLECLDGLMNDRGECSGAVEPRQSLSGTGTPITRCDRHWSQRLEQHERDRERYPDSPFAPAWFDPLDAGERWDDDY